MIPAGSHNVPIVIVEPSCSRHNSCARGVYEPFSFRIHCEANCLSTYSETCFSANVVCRGFMFLNLLPGCSNSTNSFSVWKFSTWWRDLRAGMFAFFVGSSRSDQWVRFLPALDWMDFRVTNGPKLKLQWNFMMTVSHTWAHLSCSRHHQQFSVVGLSVCWLCQPCCFSAARESNPPKVASYGVKRPQLQRPQSIPFYWLAQVVHVLRLLPWRL
jgi:hypothetical protein